MDSEDRIENLGFWIDKDLLIDIFLYILALGIGYYFGFIIHI